MVGERGPVAIMSEIPSLKRQLTATRFSRSRGDTAPASKRYLNAGIADGSIAPCDVRMTGNAIMGAINWIPKWYHGNRAMAATIVEEFPDILTRGLAPSSGL